MNTNTLNPRERLSAGMKMAAEQIAGGRYHVRRGKLPWAAEDWADKSFACGLLITASEPFARDGERNATCVAYFLGRFDSERRELDLELSDAIARDAGEFLVLLQSIKVGDEPAVLGIEQEAVTVDDVADADFRVQGVIVTFSVFF